MSTQRSSGQTLETSAPRTGRRALPIASYVVEMLGTFFLTLTVGCTVLTQNPLAPLAIGAVLMVMVFAGGHVSGAHFNPAVTLAVTMRGGQASTKLPSYWACQLLGGALGAFTAAMLTGQHPTAKAASNMPAALIAEFLFTLALCWVVLNVATSKDHPDNSFYGLAIGFTVLVGAVAVGDISGGVFNPAVGLGAGIMGLLTWEALPLWALIQLVAGACAALLFRATSPQDH
ncbi:MIP/aquaporin family protein [Austwickia chelonae]|uniref:MIP/aquaporin family protein n=1 Tax=Austwickia chelonae TaxID=100225 RepID=UPI000E2695E3|nr:aquaporin [Austwickia chelonae]